MLLKGAPGGQCHISDRGVTCLPSIWYELLYSNLGVSVMAISPNLVLESGLLTKPRDSCLTHTWWSYILFNIVNVRNGKPLSVITCMVIDLTFTLYALQNKTLKSQNVEKLEQSIACLNYSIQSIEPPSWISLYYCYWITEYQLRSHRSKFSSGFQGMLIMNDIMGYMMIHRVALCKMSLRILENSIHIQC